MNDMQIDVAKITRFEVIDHINGDGRVLVRYLPPDGKLELSLQDDGRTLKVFISPSK